MSSFRLKRIWNCEPTGKELEKNPGETERGF
jgi:hypothetical protein